MMNAFYDISLRFGVHQTNKISMQHFHNDKQLGNCIQVICRSDKMGHHPISISAQILYKLLKCTPDWCAMSHTMSRIVGCSHAVVLDNVWERSKHIRQNVNAVGGFLNRCRVYHSQATTTLNRYASFHVQPTQTQRDQYNEITQCSRDR